MPLKVAVIGAGACGLCALRRLSEEPDAFTPTAFEMSSKLGGLWVYDDVPYPISKTFEVYSSVYKNLKTNLAKEASFFPGFPFPSHLPSYVMHEDMLIYLEDFARHYTLEKYIQFNRQVVLVLPVQLENGTTQWHVEVKDMKNQQTPNEIYTFDAVLICNGHYSIPRVPDIPGLDSFEGTVLHSHYYRDPEKFAGQRVACLGGGISGCDIAMELSRYTPKVFWSQTNSPSGCQLPDNVEETKKVTQVNAKSIIIDNTREENIEVIILCQGYSYQFPFLHPACHVDVDVGGIKPAYKHIFHTEFPSLCFIGLIARICAFPLFDAQVQFALAALKGSMKLPNREEMEKDAADDYVARRKLGFASHKCHELASTQWDYYKDLARVANFQQWPAARRSLCNESFINFFKDTLHYREYNYDITDEEDEHGYVHKT